MPCAPYVSYRIFSFLAGVLHVLTLNTFHDACPCACMCMYVAVCVCMWLYVYVCGCMCMYVAVCVCMWMYVYVCVFVLVCRQAAAASRVGGDVGRVCVGGRQPPKRQSHAALLHTG